VQHLAAQEFAKDGKFLGLRGAGAKAIEIGVGVQRTFVRRINCMWDGGADLSRLDALSHGDSL